LKKRKNKSTFSMHLFDDQDKQKKKKMTDEQDNGKQISSV
jgi:hypothetical protein